MNRLKASSAAFFIVTLFILSGTGIAHAQTNDSAQQLQFREVAENMQSDDVVAVLNAIYDGEGDLNTLPESLTARCGGNDPKAYQLTQEIWIVTPPEDNDPDAPIISVGQDNLPVFLCPVVLDGSIVKYADVQKDQSGDLSVGVTLTGTGAAQFNELIGKSLTNQQVAIVFNSKIISAPTIQEDLKNGLVDNELTISVGNSKQQKADVERLARILGEKSSPKNKEQDSDPAKIGSVLLIFACVGFVIAAGAAIFLYFVLKKRKDEANSHLNPDSVKGSSEINESTKDQE